MKNHYLESLMQARKELDEVDKQLGDLWNRKSSLGKLIRVLEPLVGEASEPELTPAPEQAVPEPMAEEQPLLPAIPPAFNAGPLWSLVANLMKGSGPFRIVDAATAVEGHIGRPLGVNRSQLIRNGLINHPETFRRNPQGLYEVVEGVSR